MIMFELVRRLYILAKLFFVFGVISLINGMIIRMIIKGAAIVVYPILCLQQCIRRNYGFQNRYTIYQSLGQTGALSAYLDRNEMSKCNLFLQVLFGLIVYYLMYLQI